MECFFQNVLLSVLVIFFLSCRSNKDPNSDEKWFSEMNSILGERGHEELTAHAILFANAELNGGEKIHAISFDEVAWKLESPIVFGNFATDFPSWITDRLTTPAFNMFAAFADETGSSEPLSFRAWGSHPKLQSLHFMRSVSQVDRSGTSAACLKSRDRIAAASKKALKYWVESPREPTAFRDFWLGAALHTIQDSFSPSHTVRSRDENRTIKDLCIYAQSIQGICEHSMIDFKDSIWLEDSADPPTKVAAERFALLTDEAKDAVMASKAFLVHMTKAFTYAKSLIASGKKKEIVEKKTAENLDQHMKAFFTQVNGAGNGWFICPESD